jgi:hypothetical protein
VAGACEFGNEPSVSIKWEEFLSSFMELLSYLVRYH